MISRELKYCKPSPLSTDTGGATSVLQIIRRFEIFKKEGRSLLRFLHHYIQYVDSITSTEQKSSAETLQ